jgi:hypothetical protein
MSCIYYQEVDHACEYRPPASTEQNTSEYLSRKKWADNIHPVVFYAQQPHTYIHINTHTHFPYLYVTPNYSEFPHFPSKLAPYTVHSNFIV